MEAPWLEKYVGPYWGIVIGIYEEIKAVEMAFSRMAYNYMGLIEVQVVQQVVTMIFLVILFFE